MEPEAESSATPVRTPAKLDDGDGDANDSGGEEQPNPPDEGDAYELQEEQAMQHNDDVEAEDADVGQAEAGLAAQSEEARVEAQVEAEGDALEMPAEGMESQAADREEKDRPPTDDAHATNTSRSVTLASGTRAAGDAAAEPDPGPVVAPVANQGSREETKMAKPKYRHQKLAGPGYNTDSVNARVREQSRQIAEKREAKRTEQERIQLEIKEKMEKAKEQKRQAADDARRAEKAKLQQAMERQATLDRAKAERAEREAEQIQKKLKLQALVFQRMMRSGMARMFSGWREVWLSNGSALATAALEEMKAARRRKKEEEAALRAAEQAELQAISMSDGHVAGSACCTIA
jgi:hypothetical protein